MEQARIRRFLGDAVVSLEEVGLALYLANRGELGLDRILDGIGVLIQSRQQTQTEPAGPVPSLL